MSDMLAMVDVGVVVLLWRNEINRSLNYVATLMQARVKVKAK